MKKIMIATTTHLAQNYEKALELVGLSSIVSVNLTDAKSCDGLLIPGGGDIAPILFHEKNWGSRNICLEEDLHQLTLFSYFYKNKKPILGICKGMQIINVALGGSITQNLQTHALHEYQNKDRYHITKALPGSILHQLYGEYFTTNSAHHQGISNIGKKLTVTQRSFDNVVEAIEHNSAPILGVQWHPERLIDNEQINHCVYGLKIFTYFHQLLE